MTRQQQPQAAWNLRPPGKRTQQNNGFSSQSTPRLVSCIAFPFHSASSCLEHITLVVPPSPIRISTAGLAIAPGTFSAFPASGAEEENLSFSKGHAKCEQRVKGQNQYVGPSLAREQSLLHSGTLQILPTVQDVVPRNWLITYVLTATHKSVEVTKEKRRNEVKGQEVVISSKLTDWQRL